MILYSQLNVATGQWLHSILPICDKAIIGKVQSCPGDCTLNVINEDENKALRRDIDVKNDLVRMATKQIQDYLRQFWLDSVK